MQEGFSHTREYGKRGNINRKFFTVQIKVIISNENESKGATVNFTKIGRFGSPVALSVQISPVNPNSSVVMSLIRIRIVNHFSTILSPTII